MANFVTNYCANATVVNRVFGVHVKERRLKDSRREYNFV